MKNSIPYSQALRYRRIINDENNLQDELKLLTDKFLRAGFPKKLLSEQIARINNIERTKLLDKPTTSTNNFKISLPLIIQYHFNIDSHVIKEPIYKMWNKFINSDTDINSKLQSEKIQLIYKRNTTLSNILTNNNLTEISSDNSVETLAQLMNDNYEQSENELEAETGTFPCRHPRCKCCEQVHTAQYIPLINNNFWYVTEKFTCNTKNIIYRIECQLCRKTYIGLTEDTLKNRLNNHRYSIKNNKPTAIGIHFNLPKHNITHLKISIIKSLHSISYNDKLKIEKDFIQKTKSYYPYGINYYPLIKHTFSQ
ncbi:MAG: GIY-YIG nuclease family protein [Richelia sp. SM2_1_7]|nr:GIY-YIG nuclease family protein [Richelia sp. SM2_1_7]